VPRYGHLWGWAGGGCLTGGGGDMVAYGGSPGGPTSAHLHYEILLYGQLSNPLRLLTGR
jgi:hypothetical protein